MKTRPLSFAALAVSLVVAGLGSHALAQSGTRQRTRSQPSRAKNAAPLALQGYCPVCVMEMKKWVPGRPEHSVVYDGHTYRFPGKEQKQMFEKHPAKYTPALHGDCVVSAVEMGKRVPGKVNLGQFYQGRLFLFPSEEQRKMFTANPAKYADADLALGGKCAVCRLEMKKDVAGKPEYTVHYQGLRYLFPGEEQKKMFLANPGKYAVKPTEGSGPAAGPQSSNPRPSTIRTVSIRGKTGCAGCEHGVKLLSNPDELGLAVTSEGPVYVVEQANERYPSIYDNHFEGHLVALNGTLLKEQGKFGWVRPDGLEPLDGLGTRSKEPRENNLTNSFEVT